MAEFDAEHQAQLDEHLRELRRISAMKKELQGDYDRHTAEAVQLLGGESRMIKDPIDGSVQIANVRASETIVVDAGELLEALIEQYHGDVETAEVVWKSVLKPPAVDTKDDGLFLKATQERTEEGLPALISPETVAQVATFKKAKAFVGFSKPGG